MRLCIDMQSQHYWKGRAIERHTFFSLCTSGFALMMTRDVLKAFETTDLRQQPTPGVDRKLRAAEMKRRRGARLYAALIQRLVSALGSR